MQQDEDDVTIEIVYDASERTVITARIAVAGSSIELMGEISESGRMLLATGGHIVVRGPTTKRTMETIARRVMKEMDYDEIIVEGAARTLGPVRDIDRVGFGSAEDFVLSASPRPGQVDVVSAAMSLARRGISLLKAKRAIEAMLQEGRTYIHLPTVEDAAALATELAAAGMTASPRSTPKAVSVVAIRKSLGLTQEQFALRFGFELDTLRRWESGRSAPDTAARSYLTLIRKEPETIQRIADLA